MAEKENFIKQDSLSENQIFEQARQEINTIQENLLEKKTTIDEAKDELKKINERLQSSQIEQKDKKEIGKIFEKLANLEKNIDENDLLTEVNEVENLLEKLTKRDLANLKQNIKGIESRSVEVQEGIQIAANNLESTINNAAEDKNPVANRIGKAMKRLNS